MLQHGGSGLRERRGGGEMGKNIPTDFVDKTHVKGKTCTIDRHS